MLKIILFYNIFQGFTREEGSGLSRIPRLMAILPAMDFFTRIDIPAADFKIDYESRIAFFGSCFADNISAQFSVR